MSLSALAAGAVVAARNPWPRYLVNEGEWRDASAALADGALTLIGLWGEVDCVHLAVLDAAQSDLAVLTLECVEGSFPSIGALHAPAIRFERAVEDLFGLEPKGAIDRRAWLDHGRWSAGAPLARTPHAARAPSYDFLPAEGESLHQVAVGPVHAGIIEPGHFRFTANGDTVVRLEERLGYAHKGVESLMAGADLERGLKLAGRVSGDSTVAYAFAFARAAEAALGIEAPPRAQRLRAVMAELERLANHFGDIGAICNDAAFVMMHAHCSVLRERVLRSADACFGHRLMRDFILPGGVARDIDASGVSHLRKGLRDWRRRFRGLITLYDETPSLEDRTVGTGIVKPELARQFGAGGFVGRASGRAFDARTAFPYPPYDRFTPEVPVLQEGDVDARVWIRIREAEHGMTLIERMLDDLPDGALRVETPACAGEGMALVEGFRGDVLVWLKLDAEAKIARCHLRDPSWMQWPLLEAAIEGNIVGDFPLCNKSFNCSYSGHDL
ncbi:MAG: NADH-quinone oxidoreductase subunit C [Proteobacteria bacterium]|nr:NADH-quinone oxidoreductase subunit C [Pseudomonadota bacterium]